MTTLGYNLEPAEKRMAVGLIVAFFGGALGCIAFFKGDSIITLYALCTFFFSFAISPFPVLGRWPLVRATILLFMIVAILFEFNAAFVSI
jgi:hypothetical protein